MQASRIAIGKRYAAKVHGKVVDLYVGTIVTERTRVKTENFVGGSYIDEAGKSIPVAKVEVADVIDELENHQALMAEQARRKAEADAREAARAGKQWYAVRALAKALDAQAVKERYGSGMKWDRDAAAIIVRNSDIEINEHAINALIAFLDRAGVFIDGDDEAAA